MAELPFPFLGRTPKWLETVDWATPSAQSAPAGVDGVLEVVFPPIPSDLWGLVERITVSTDSTVNTTATVYVGDAVPANVRDYSGAANFDVADEAQPILVPSGAQVRIRWVGASQGAMGTATLQLRLVRLRSLEPPVPSESSAP